MFSGCEGLISLNLSNFNTSNVVNMQAMFSYCSSLVSLDLSSFDTSNVVDMRGMFSSCGSLVSLDLSSFDTSNVVRMSGMFSYCRSLVSLNLSNFNTSNVVNMQEMFSGCKGLISLNLSNFDTSKVTSYRRMFQLSKILVLDLTGFYFENLELDNIDRYYYTFVNTSIKFLRIKDVKYKEPLIKYINNLENKTDMYLCLNDANLMAKIDKSITICCEFDIYTQTCDSSNYFSLYYGNSVSYDTGFENDNRKEIAFLGCGGQMKRAFESISIAQMKI